MKKLKVKQKSILEINMNYLIIIVIFFIISWSFITIFFILYTYSLKVCKISSPVYFLALQEKMSTTVGIPMAITGIPSVFLLISFLLFSTPAPGTIPVSAI